MIATPEKTKISRLTVDEFTQLYADMGGIEWIDGEIIKLSPTISGHNLKIRKLFLALYAFATEHQLGEVFAEATFILPDSPEIQWVEGSREPDVMFVSAAKYEVFLSQPEAESKPFRFIPDLVVEVISPTDRYSEVSKKIKAYLADGVRLIWAVDMEEKTITVYSPDRPVQILTVEQTLTGGDVLPGFTMMVQAIFQ